MTNISTLHSFIFLSILLILTITIPPTTSNYLPDYQSCDKTFYCQWLRQAQGVVDKPFQWLPNDDVIYHQDLNIITFSLYNTQPLPTPSHTSVAHYSYDPFNISNQHNAQTPELDVEPTQYPLQVAIWITAEGVMRFKVIENVEIIRSKGFRWHPHDVIQHQFSTPAPGNVTIYRMDSNVNNYEHTLCLLKNEDQYCVLVEITKPTGDDYTSTTSQGEGYEEGNENNPRNKPFSKTSVNFDQAKFTISHLFNGKAVTILNALSMFDYQQRYERAQNDPYHRHSTSGKYPSNERLTPNFHEFPHQSISLDVIMPFSSGLHGLPEHNGSYQLPITSPNKFFRAPLNKTNLPHLSKPCLRDLAQMSMDTATKALPNTCVPGYENDYPENITRSEVDYKNFKKMNKQLSRNPFKLYALDIGIYDSYDTGSSMYGGIPFVLGKSHSTHSTQHFTSHLRDNQSHKVDYKITHDHITPCTGVFINSISELYMDVSQTSLLTRASYNNDNGYMNRDKFLHPNAPTMYWMLETGDLDVFSLVGHHCHEVHRQYHTLTYRPILLPQFSLGFHQSHWNYLSGGKSMTVLYHSDTADIPVDVLWLDIEHTDKKQYLSFAPNTFSRPLSTQLAFAQTGRNTVVIIDPHLSSEERQSTVGTIKDDNGEVSDKPRIYALAQESINKRFTIMQIDNDQHPQQLKPVSATCWPGVSVWSDYSQEMIREWWSERIYKAMCPGIDIDTILNNPTENDLLYRCLSQESKKRFYIANGITAERIANDPGVVVEFEKKFSQQDDLSSEEISQNDIEIQRDPTIMSDLEHVYAPYTHIWNDMNEPAVFEMSGEDDRSVRAIAPQRTMPKDSIHLQLLTPRKEQDINRALREELEKLPFVGRIVGEDDEPQIDPETIVKVTQFGSILYHTIVHDNKEICPAVINVRNEFDDHSNPQNQQANDQNVDNYTECWLQHQAVHNFYGISYHASTMHGANKVRQDIIRDNDKFTQDPSITPTSHGHMQPSQRQFTLTRSFYSGSHAVGSMWTGDNSALFSHVLSQINMGLSLSSAGYSATGADLGGFAVEETHPENVCEMNIRSYHAGIAHALYRSHAIKEASFKEPWKFIMDNVGDHKERDQEKENMKWFDLQCGQQLRLLAKQRVRLTPHLFTVYTDNHLSGQQVLNGVDMITPEKSRVDGYDGYLSNGLFILTPFDEPAQYNKYTRRQLITRPLTQFTWESLTKGKLFDGKKNEYNQWIEKYAIFEQNNTSPPIYSSSSTTKLKSSKTGSSNYHKSHRNHLEIIPFYDLNTGTRFRSSLVGLTTAQITNKSVEDNNNTVELTPHMVFLNILPTTTFPTFVDKQASVYPITTPIFTSPSSIIYTYQSTGRSQHSSKSRGLTATVTMNKPLPLVAPVNKMFIDRMGVNGKRMEEYDRFDIKSFIPIYASGFMYLDMNNTDHVVMNPNFFPNDDRVELSQDTMKKEQKKLLLYPGSRSLVIGLDQQSPFISTPPSQFPFAMITYPIINPPTYSPTLANQDNGISYIPFNPFSCSYPGEYTNQCFMSLSTRKKTFRPLQSSTSSCQLNDPLNPHLCINVKHPGYKPYGLILDEKNTIGLDLRKISLFNLLQSITNSQSNTKSLPQYAVTIILKVDPEREHLSHPLSIASKQVYGHLLLEMKNKLNSLCPKLTTYPVGLPQSAIYTPPMCTVDINTIMRDLDVCKANGELFNECQLINKVQIAPLLIESTISFQNTHYQSTTKAPTRYFNQMAHDKDVIDSILQYSFDQIKPSQTPYPSQDSSVSLNQIDNTEKKKIILPSGPNTEDQGRYLRETLFGSTFFSSQQFRIPSLESPMKEWQRGNVVTSYLNEESSILRSQHDLFKEYKQDQLDRENQKSLARNNKKKNRVTRGINEIETLYHFKVNGFDGDYEFKPMNGNGVNRQSFDLSPGMSFIYDGGNDGLAIDINVVFNVEYHVLEYTITNFI